MNNAPTVPPPGGHNMPNRVPYKTKCVQQQLIDLLHAYKCLELENNPNNISQPCELPRCGPFMELIRHMRVCQNARNCPISHCSSSKQIIKHWNKCVKSDCIVCFPLKHRNPADKELHQFIPDDERRALVDLIVDAISISTDGVVCGRRIQNKVECAEIIENGIYRKADTLSDYYRMLAAKKWEIEMDIEARRRLCTAERERQDFLRRQRESERQLMNRRRLIGFRVPQQPDAF